MRYFEIKKARIEVVPMIDIMFFLLVFFIMVALKMIPSTGLPAKLPGSATAQDLPKAKWSLLCTPTVRSKRDTRN